MFSISDEPLYSLRKKSNDIQQEVNELIEITKLEREKFYCQNILYELVTDCIMNDSLNGDLKTKVETIVFAIQVQPCLEIVNPNAVEAPTLTVLGLSKISSPDLNYEERCLLKNAVQQAMAKKYNNIVHDLEKMTDQKSDTLISMNKFLCNSNLCLEDKVLFEEKLKLNEQRETYFNNQLEYYNILESFTTLRIQTLPKYCHTKIEEYDLLKKVYKLRVQVLNEKLRSQIFTETKSSVASYEEIIKEIKEQEKEYKYDIQKLEELKEKYKQVSCRQFKETLSSYKQYIASFEKLNKLREQLNLK